MSVHTAEVAWERGDQVFTDGRYSREHRVRFDGGIDVAGSASPHVVRLPFSTEAAVDPEEMLVASLSACHMLTFLHLAKQAGFCVDTYVDRAAGVIERSDEGRLAVTRVTLRPEIVFSGEKTPFSYEIDQLHRRAHEECFIANSVRTEVRVEAPLPAPTSQGRDDDGSDHPDSLTDSSVRA